MEMTNEEIVAMCERAASTAVALYVANHPCHFDPLEERPHLHSFARACRIYKADEGDIMVMIYGAKSFGTMLKRAGFGLVIAIVVAGLVVLSGDLFRNPQIILRYFGK